MKRSPDRDGRPRGIVDEVVAQIEAEREQGRRPDARGVVDSLNLP